MNIGRKKTVYILAALIVLAAGIVLVGSTLANGVTRNSSQQMINNDYNVLFDYRNPQGSYVKVPADVSVQEVNPVTEGMFWCPGRTEIIYLKLDNRELFAVDGTLSVNVYGPGFGDTLTYAVIHGATPNHPNNWKDFLQQAAVKGTLKAGADKENAEKYTLMTEQHLDIQADSNPEANDYYVAFAIHMDENASNAYQNNFINIDLKLQLDANFKPGANPNDPNAEKSL